MCQLLEVNEIPIKLTQIVKTKTQGIPSWCKQLVKDLVETNVVQFCPKSSFSFNERKVSYSKQDDTTNNVSDTIDEETEASAVISEPGGSNGNMHNAGNTLKVQSRRERRESLASNGKGNVVFKNRLFTFLKHLLKSQFFRTTVVAFLRTLIHGCLLLTVESIVRFLL